MFWGITVCFKKVFLYALYINILYSFFFITGALSKTVYKKKSYKKLYCIYEEIENWSKKKKKLEKNHAFSIDYELLSTTYNITKQNNITKLHFYVNLNMMDNWIIWKQKQIWKLNFSSSHLQLDFF